MNKFREETKNKYITLIKKSLFTITFKSDFPYYGKENII